MARDAPDYDLPRTRQRHCVGCHLELSTQPKTTVLHGAVLLARGEMICTAHHCHL
jgi:hypothetical protein